MAASDQIHNFVLTVEAYQHSQSTKDLSQLQRQVKILSVLSDLGVFCGDGLATCQFYTSLHRLLTGLTPGSQLTWLVVRLLEHLCTDQTVCRTLAERYCFLAPVASLLASRPDRERTMLLLNVTEQLSENLTLHRCEPFVRPLLSTLSELVCEGEADVWAAAVRTLCRLLRCSPGTGPDQLLVGVHRKRLARRLVSADPAGQLERLCTAELLLRLQPRQPPLPADRLHSFLQLVFSALSSGLAQLDVRLMNQAGHLLDSLLSERAADGYNQLAPNVSILVDQLGTEQAQPAASHVLRALESLIRRGAGTADIWRPVAELAAKLLVRPGTLEVSASLLEAVVVSQLISPEAELLQVALSAVQQYLEQSRPAAAEPDSDSCRPQTAALIPLISSLVVYPGWCRRLADSWSPQLLRQLLAPLCSAPGGGADNQRICASVLATLELARTLGTKNAGWLEAQADVVRDPQLLTWLGRALTSGHRGLVQRTISLLCRDAVPSESVQRLGEVVVESSWRPGGPPADLTSGPAPEPSHQTLELVQTVLDKLKQQKPERSGDDPASTVDIMELYEFKLSSLAHTVQDLESALQAANNLNTSTRLQLTQTTAEGDSVRRLLVSAERRVEELRSAGRAAEARLAAADQQVARLREERAGCQQQLQQQHSKAQQLERELASRGDSLRAAQLAIEEAEQRCSRLNQQLGSLQHNLDELRACSQQQERQLAEREQQLQEAVQTLQARDQQLATARQEVQTLELLCRSQEQSLAERDQQCAELTEENRALLKITEMIHSISSKAKDKK